MRRVLLILLGVCGSVLGATAQPTPAEAFVQVRGRQLFTPKSEPLLLRGINLGNWLLPEGYMLRFEKAGSPWMIENVVAELLGDVAAARFWHEWQQHYITREDIAFIKRLGLNSVRVPFNWRVLVSATYPHTLEGPGWALLDRVVTWCREEGLWVVLDLHGAPGGQTGANIDDSRGRPLLFDDPDAQALTIELWTALARRYRDEPTVIGFDLLNEPIADYHDQAHYDPRLAPLYRRIGDAVRAVAPHQILFLGGAQWNTDFEAVGPPFAPNTVYTFHTYWTAPDVSAIERYLAVREQYQVPLWLGESGENTDEWISSFRQVLEAQDIGWCFWPYKKLDATSCIASIPPPRDWPAIIAYAEAPRGTYDEIRAALPSLDVAQRALAELLENLRLSQNRLNRGYIEALGLTHVEP